MVLTSQRFNQCTQCAVLTPADVHNVLRGHLPMCTISIKLFVQALLGNTVTNSLLLIKKLLIKTLSCLVLGATVSKYCIIGITTIQRQIELIKVNAQRHSVPKCANCGCQILWALEHVWPNDCSSNLVRLIVVSLLLQSYCKQACKFAVMWGKYGISNGRNHCKLAQLKAYYAGEITWNVHRTESEPSIRRLPPNLHNLLVT